MCYNQCIECSEFTTNLSISKRSQPAMKRSVVIALSIIIVILLGVILFQSNSNSNGYGASLATVCLALKYEENAECGYLTLTFERQKGEVITKTFKVDDKKIRDQITQADLADIIGVQLIVNLPNKVIKENNLNSTEINIDFLFTTNTFDDYFTVVDISLK